MLLLIVHCFWFITRLYTRKNSNNSGHCHSGNHLGFWLAYSFRWCRSERRSRVSASVFLHPPLMWCRPRAWAGMAEKAPVTQPTQTRARLSMWGSCFPFSFMPHENFWEIHFFMFPLPYKKQNQRKCFFYLVVVQSSSSYEFSVKGHFGRSCHQTILHQKILTFIRPAVNFWPFQILF